MEGTGDMEEDLEAMEWEVCMVDMVDLEGMGWEECTEACMGWEWGWVWSKIPIS